MTQSNAERQRQWRERQKQAGYRAMTIWFPPEAVDILASYPERERGQVILNALRNVTSNTPVTLPDNELLNRLAALEGQVAGLTQAVQGLVTGNTPVTIPGNTPVTLQRNNNQAPLVSKSAEELARAAQSLHKQGLSYAQIAERWEREKVPTLKGGRWHKGTIGNLVQRYCQ